jgi:phosphoglycolate phosphatase
VWSEVTQRSVEAGRQIEPILRSAEIEAASTARPTPGAAELLVACRDTHRPVAIVSNNTSEAIARYLERDGLTDLVQHVEGRDGSDPAFMKPNPRGLHRAIQALAVNPQGCVFVGDSESDAMAACTADVPFIGYANKPGKEPRLRDAGAQHVVTDLYPLALAMAGTR